MVVFCFKLITLHKKIHVKKTRFNTSYNHVYYDTMYLVQAV